MKKILRDQSGMALPTVLGIMLVVAILATGMFYFSYNELNFSTINKEQGQAQYLAKAGVEIAAKAFPGVSASFDLGESAAPITADLYLHFDATGNPQMNEVEEGSKGKVTVTVQQKKREVVDATGNTEEVEVWAYEAEAEVDGSKSTAKGFTLPTAKATTQSATGATAEQARYLEWMSKTGTVSKTAPYTDGAPTEAGGISGIINSIFHTHFNELQTCYAMYNGVVTVDKENVTSGKVNLSSSDDRIFIWAAPAVVMEAPLDLRGAGRVNGLAIAANTIVFEEEVCLYANSTESRMGDLILQPLNGTAQVYFRDNVYAYIGSSRYKLFDAGTVCEFTETVDLFTWAVNHDKVNLGLSNWLRRIVKDQHTGDLEVVENPPQTIPTTNSLTKIIWE